MKERHSDQRTSETSWVEKIDLAVDGALPQDELHGLETQLESSAALRAEREQLIEIREALASSRIDVDAGFEARVMNALPIPSWAPVRKQGWGVAVAAAVVLTVLSGLIFSLSGAGSVADPVLGIAGAARDLLVASMLTGAGLLGASWRGLGLALQQLFAVSPWGVAIMGIGIVALNVLFFRLLRRRSVGFATSRHDDSR